MIKFRYKRKEPANNGGSGGSTTNTNSVKSPSNKSVEIKSNDNKDKDTAKHTPLKCETPNVVVVESTKSTSSLPPSQVIKAKTSSEQEYMEDCIRAIVVSVVRN